MGESNMQNHSNSAQTNNESRFRNRTAHDDNSGQAVRQGRTDVVVRRQRDVQQTEQQRNAAPQGTTIRESRRVPDQNLNPSRPQQQRQMQRPQENASQRQNRRPTDPRAASAHAPVSPRQNERPSQVVVGKSKYEKAVEQKPNPVIVDSPNIDSKKNVRETAAETPGKGGKNDNSQKKFYFQRPREVSTLRKMLIVVFGLLFVWCIAPAFFHIRGIGVFSSSAVMLGICLTAMFWHLIDRNWTLKKAAAVSLAALVFTACVAAFGAVSGMMLKASLTAVPSDYASYTVVVLGCKAHGDQPSWMLGDRLKKAYSALSENPNVKCVVTGGKGDDEQFTEAYVMKKYLVEKGISPERIYVEELSGSTEENLLYTKSLIKLNGLSENIVIVTDRFHELRARIWAEKSGFKNIYSGCCETRSYLVTGYWFREMFGLARLYVFGI